MLGWYFKMKRLVSVLLLYSLAFLQSVSVLAQSQRDPQDYQHFEILDNERKFQLEWVTNWSERRIIFHAKVQTRGYVALGLSARGELEGADIVIGGVLLDGSSYFSDRHGVRNGVPQLDSSQDWRLEAADENGTHTFLSFSRPFRTCDDENDYQINEHDTTVLIWAYGNSDDATREWTLNRNRGVFGAYLLHPNVIPRAIKESTYRPGPAPQNVLRQLNLNVWTVSTRRRVPAQETLYDCTIHKAPRLRRKHHIVGFHTRLETPEALNHTHHLILYRCYPPQGEGRRLFETFVNGPGQTCYLPGEPTGPMQTQYCYELVNGFAIGARITFFPEHTGQSFAESDDEYYMLQIHYDNPDRLTNLEYDVNLDMYYTSDLRPNELGYMSAGHTTPGSPSVLIPPETPVHEVYSHCGSACTNNFVPPEGIRIVMASLHTHYSGRKARLRHFRGGQELPWLVEDSSYNPYFQNFKVLNEERRLLPGDHLTMQCEDDNSWTSGTVVGGFSTTQEMCIGFFYYYTKIDGISQCRSQIEDPNYWRKYLGVNNITWDESQLDYVATSPRRVAGMTMASISDEQVRWTRQLRNELQDDHRYRPQVSSCAVNSPRPLGGRRPSGTTDDLIQQDVQELVSWPQVGREYRQVVERCVSGSESQLQNLSLNNRNWDSPWNSRRKSTGWSRS